MRLFSKELEVLDGNTYDYMIDEMQNTIDQMKNTIKENAVEIDYQKTQINKQKEALNDRDKLLEEQRLRIAQPEAQLKKNV